jgi:hypothetical protein
MSESRSIWGNKPGLARIAFAAPAIPPAIAISLRDSCGKGETMRLEYTYDANNKELTPAIPRRGLAIPAEEWAVGMNTTYYV